MLNTNIITPMTESIRIGQRVKVLIDSKFWESTGWFTGIVVRIDPFSQHRSFYWIELDAAIQPAHGTPTKLISVLNPDHIQSTE